jgi:hypothetical protein
MTFTIHSLQMHEIKLTSENVLYLKFNELISFLKLLVSITNMVFTIPVICISLHIIIVPILCLAFTAHTLMFTVNIPKIVFILHSIHSPHVQLFKNALTTSYRDILCHGLDPLAQQFQTGPLHCPCNDVRTGSLLRAIENTIIS